MSSENNSHKTQIMIALIGVLGVLGTGLLANWDKVFPPEKKPIQAMTPVLSTGNTTPAAEPPPRTAPPTVEVAPPVVTSPANQPAPATPAVQNTSTQSPPAQPQPFSGTYVGVSTEGMIQSQFQVTFQRQGNSVTGTYFQNGMQGTIQGTVQGDTMHYQWSLGGYSGKAVCTMQGNKTIGTWGYGTSVNNGGTTVAHLQ